MNQECEWVHPGRGVMFIHRERRKLRTPSGVRCGLHNNESSRYLGSLDMALLTECGASILLRTIDISLLRSE